MDEANTMITIGSSTVRTPSDMRVSFLDVQNVERNAAGLAVIDRIARKKRVSMSWNYISNSDLSTVLSAISGIYFNLTYPEASGAVTISCYVEMFEAGLQKYSGGAAVGWKDTKLEVIER